MPFHRWWILHASKRYAKCADFGHPLLLLRGMELANIPTEQTKPLYIVGRKVAAGFAQRGMGVNISICLYYFMKGLLTAYRIGTCYCIIRYILFCQVYKAFSCMLTKCEHM
jgi:hypothetical protein